MEQKISPGSTGRSCFANAKAISIKGRMILYRQIKVSYCGNVCKVSIYTHIDCPWELCTVSIRYMQLVVVQRIVFGATFSYLTRTHSMCPKRVVVSLCEETRTQYLKIGSCHMRFSWSFLQKTRGSQLNKIFVHPHIFNEKYPIRGIGKTKKYILNMKKIWKNMEFSYTLAKSWLPLDKRLPECNFRNAVAI